MRGYSYLACLLFSVVVFMALGISTTQEEGFSYAAYTEPHALKNSIEVFGINSDKYSVHYDIIQPNQVLGEILGNCNINTAMVHEIAGQECDGFDVRNLKAGHGYTVLCDADQKAQYFIYESDPTMYVMLDFTGGTGTVDVKKRQIEHKIKAASGVINSSLYLTLEQNKISPKIAVKLAQVYAWSVDFFHLQKGDYFKILYEEIYADGKLVGVGEIKSAVFNQNGQDNYAIYFEKDDTRGYYDEKNNLLQRSFLRAPVEYGRISSRYNRNRFHPVLKTVRAHLGTDFAAPYGTPIISTADGTVQKVGYTSGNGNFVKIKHDQTYETQYLHMSKFAKGIKAGTHIKQGQVIGYVGSTGLATGPHVCYRFWKNGTQVDPLREKFSVSKPIDKKMLPYYAVHRDSMVALLRDIQLPSEETVQVATIASQTDSH